jgi:hypothetical protein
LIYYYYFIGSAFISVLNSVPRYALWLAASSGVPGCLSPFCSLHSLLFCHALPDPTIESNYSKTVNLDDMVTVLVRSPSLPFHSFFITTVSHDRP